MITLPDIFISYAREDRERVETVARALGDLGWSVFWDRNIPTGQTWRSHIGQALGDARCVIVAWSQHSIASHWVSEEADDAKERGVLLPVFLESVPPPIGFRSIQAADLSDWEAGRESPAFDQLVRDIETILGGSAHHTADAPMGKRPARTRRRVPSRKAALLFGGLLIGVFTAVIAFLTHGTPPAVRCDPDPVSRNAQGSGPVWLEFEHLDCRDPEGFLSGLVGNYGADEPYIEVNNQAVWNKPKIGQRGETVTCPSKPKVTLDIDPIRLNPGKNTIVLMESDAGGWSGDDVIGTVEIGSEAGHYECHFNERFAHYVVTWEVTQRPE